MRLTSLSLATHLLAAFITAGGVWILGGGTVGLVTGVSLSLVAAAGLGIVNAFRFKRALSDLKNAASGKPWDARSRTGVEEVDELADFLAEHNRRNAAASARNYEQVQEIDGLLAQIDRRESVRPGSGSSSAHRLRDLLRGLVGAADNDLKKALSLMEEIENSTQDMAAGALNQSEAVSKTTTYVEQMSANIDSVSQNASAANQAADAVRGCATEASTLVRDLISGMEHIRRHVEAGWRKLRALGDRTQEIGSIVETIAGIAARTDMLALNASIESVRAGEHGRGFAVVADEVRKLAEQAAQATKEVAGLIESVQIETQDSINVMAQEHAQVESEVGRAKAAGESLERISKTSSDSAQEVASISRSAEHQLRFTQEVVLAMERVSEAAKVIRSRAEGVSWTTKSLSGLVRQLDSSLSPLRGCYGRADARRAASNSNADEGAVLQDAQSLANETRRLTEFADVVSQKPAEQGANAS